MKGCHSVPEERCGNCKYFRQHYQRVIRGRYLPMWLGHCIYPRLKNRREEHCSHWCAKDAEVQDRPPD